jgi:hypothetical protein
MAFCKKDARAVDPQKKCKDFELYKRMMRAQYAPSRLTGRVRVGKNAEEYDLFGSSDNIARNARRLPKTVAEPKMIAEPETAAETETVAAPKKVMASQSTMAPEPATVLDWPFDWQLPEEYRLKGRENWVPWLTRWRAAIHSIGYTDDKALTLLDEAKLGHLLINNIGNGPVELVGGLTRGTHMFTKLRSKYEGRVPDLGDYKETLRKKYWSKLLGLQYSCDACPLAYIGEFNNLYYHTEVIVSDKTLCHTFLNGLTKCHPSDMLLEWRIKQTKALHGGKPINLSQIQDSFARLLDALPSKDHGRVKKWETEIVLGLPL